MRSVGTSWRPQEGWGARRRTEIQEASLQLPYLLADGSVDLQRPSGAINAALKSPRGARVAIPEPAVADVLVRLARALKAAGRLDPNPWGGPEGSRPDCYQLLVVARRQNGCLDEV